MTEEDTAPETEAQDAVASPLTDAPVAEPDAPAPETEGDEGPDDDQGRRKRNRRTAEERIARLTREKHDALAAAERWRKQAETLRAAPAPREAEFKSYEEFEAAKAEWLGDRTYARTAERQADEARQKADAVGAESRQAAYEAYKERAAALAAVVPDYEQIAHTAPISNDVAEAVIDMENGPQIALALGRNHAEARRISALPTRQMLIALADFAARKAAPSRTKVLTDAPPPISPATGRGGISQPDPDKMTMAEYRAWHEARSKS